MPRREAPSPGSAVPARRPGLGISNPTRQLSHEICVRCWSLRGQRRSPAPGTCSWCTPHESLVSRWVRTPEGPQRPPRCRQEGLGGLSLHYSKASGCLHGTPHLSANPRGSGWTCDPVNRVKGQRSERPSPGGQLRPVWARGGPGKASATGLLGRTLVGGVDREQRSCVSHVVLRVGFCCLL